MLAFCIKVIPLICPECKRRTFNVEGWITIRRRSAASGSGQAFLPPYAIGRMYTCARCDYRTVVEVTRVLTNRRRGKGRPAIAAQHA